MARLAFGIGTSHSPMISQPAEMWPVHAEGDKRNKELCRPPTGDVMAYEDLLAHADPAIGTWISQEKFQAQWEACQRGVDALTKALEEAAPDVAIIVTDDQGELFFDDNYPMFSIYYGDNIALVPREVPAGASPAAQSAAWGYGDTPLEIPVASDLAQHCIGSLRDQDFDVSVQRYLNEEYGGSIGPMGYHNYVRTVKPRHYGISHGFGFVIKRIMHNMPMPIVPINQNTCYRRPNRTDAEALLCAGPGAAQGHRVLGQRQEGGGYSFRGTEPLCGGRGAGPRRAGGSGEEGCGLPVLEAPRANELGDVGDAELDHGGRRHGALAVQDG